MSNSHTLNPILPIEEDNLDRPFWSVMIPTYNPRFDYLKKSLESVLVQDPGPARMQIEVVDDCSSGIDVEEMVGRIAGERIKVSRSPHNLGLAGCWNLCIEKSSGRWVHLLHQDDEVLPGFYLRLEDAIAKHEDVALIASRSFCIDDQGVINWVTERVCDLESGGRTVAGFLNSAKLQCPAVAVKRTAYEALGGFRSDFKYTLDHEMWTRIISQMGGVVVPDVLARYRSSTGNESRKLWKSAEAVSDMEKLLRLLADRFPEFNLRTARRGLWRYASRQAHQLAQANDREGAAAIRKSLRKNLPAGIRLQCLAEQALRRIAGLLGMAVKV